MSKILSETKSVTLNFALLCCICLSFLPLSVIAQPIDFFDRTIEEPVDLKYWELHQQKGIEIGSSKLVPSVIFHRPIVFWGTNFTGTADFVAAAFDSSVSFLDANFHSTADFRWTNFKGWAGFVGATFDSSVSFSAAGFHSTADFPGTDFKGTAGFDLATFDSSVNFGYAEFDSTADFWWTTFKGMAFLEGTTFKRMAFFEGTKFKGMADFGKARFGGDVTFSNAILPDTLDFRHVKDISREIDFTLSQSPLSGGKCHIALAGADISKIKLNMALFTLWFPIDTTFGKSTAGKDSIIRIDSTSYDGQMSVYESVLKKLKDDGLMESYKILDIEYRRLKYKHGGFFYWYIVDTIWQWWWNYGYSKERVFLWAIGFWVLFSLVNLIIYPKLRTEVYEITRLPQSGRNLLGAITYTAIVFFGLKMDVDKFGNDVVHKHPWLFIYLMFVYVLGLVCLGFIVNIIFTR
jgi:uncharacterized protein YjbI with pentapeptide repeats